MASAGPPRDDGRRRAGSLMVSGTGKQGYEVFDDIGKKRLTYERRRTRPLNSRPARTPVVLNSCGSG